MLTVVVGDGWAALSAVGTLAVAGQEVRWIAGTASRVLAPVPSLDSSAQGYGAVELLIELSSKLGISLGAEQSGNFLREFKNKAFREPPWAQSDEIPLWDPERNFVTANETRFEPSLAEIEEQIREKLTSAAFPNLRRIEGNPLAEIQIEQKRIVAAILASGERLECEALIYADRWGSLGKIKGIPKSLAFTRQRDPHGLLQATFTHETPMYQGVLGAFMGAMNREAGEEFERHVWGYFSSDGRKSYWTTCLSSEEGEDNHEIAKKLRRMKSTLDKMFNGFLSNVRDEQFRFEEGIIFASGEAPTEAVGLPGIEGVSFLTDGYGPSRSFQQVKLLLSPDKPDAQPEGANVSDSAQL